MPADSRRAQPLLGTLVEISLPEGADAHWHALGFAAIADVQAALSRFEPGSDISHFHALPAGASLALRPLSARLLAACSLLQRASGGMFDISQGTAPQGWRLIEGRLHKLHAGTRLDLGGIAKGYAVDRAIQALRRAGAPWACVNAGGDLRVFGPQTTRLQLRDETGGGVRDFGQLEQGSFATSHFAPGGRCALHGGGPGARHVSVAAPRCLWADALTKIVAASGDTAHPLLARFGAQAWMHH